MNPSFSTYLKKSNCQFSAVITAKSSWARGGNLGTPPISMLKFFIGLILYKSNVSKYNFYEFKWTMAMSWSDGMISQHSTPPPAYSISYILLTSSSGMFPETLWGQRGIKLWLIIHRPLFTAFWTEMGLCITTTHLNKKLPYQAGRVFLSAQNCFLCVLQNIWYLQQQGLTVWLW